MIRSKLASVIDIFTKAGYEVTARATQSQLDASAAAEYACLTGYDMLVCSGGDGTLNEVVQGVINSGTHVPLGYIPCGSTNDFSRALHIPKGIENAAAWMMEGGRFACDVGMFNDRSFMYIAAFGAFIEATYETPQNVKNVIGHAAYILNGLTRLTKIRSYHVRVEFEDQVLEDDYIFGMVTNSASVAGLLSMNDFLLDDGQHEVTLIKKPGNPLDLKRIISSVLNMQQDLDTEYVKCFRASNIRFVSTNEMPWTIDGEFGGAGTIAEICNVQQAITIAVGKDTGQVS